MNTMNYFGKVRIRSLEELNSGINLYINNFVENVSVSDNILPDLQQNEIEHNPDEHATQLQEESVLSTKPTVMQIETNFFNPTPDRFTTDWTQHQAIQIEYKEKLSFESCVIEMDRADTSFSDLNTEQTQTNSQNYKENLDNKADQASPVLVESNNEIDLKPTPYKCSQELPDDSFCFMDYVETVFDVGCNRDDLNCLCAPLQLQIQEGKYSKNPEMSYNVHDHLIDFEIPELEKADNISVENTKVQQNDLEIPAVSAKSNIDEQIDPRPSLTYLKSENIPLDDALLNQFVSSDKRVIAGTAFAVDALKYGQTANVTAIFLTHLHSHQGLRGNFSKPIYLSRITANILREITAVNESMLNVMDLNNTVTIDGVKVTALDANYCPGAIMLLFQLSSGLNILYTGDFRASSQMELNPFVRAIKIDLLYLDTAYISSKVSSQSQEKSISDAISIIRKFKFSHMDKRILFVFGHVAMGSEELWLEIADTFDFKIWTDELRLKMLTAIGNDEYIQRFVPNAKQADMHLINHSSVSSYGIHGHWETFRDAYDIALGINPKQWVDTKCRQLYNVEITIADVEYSGHSNENEIRKFLAFLQPKRVIAIANGGKSTKQFPEVPLSWYRQKCCSPLMKQASMYDFFKAKPKK